MLLGDRAGDLESGPSFQRCQSLRVHASRLSITNASLSQLSREGPDQDLSRGRGLLEPGADDHGFARHEDALRGRSASDHIPGVDPNTEGDRAATRHWKRGDRVADRECRPNRAIRVVIVSARNLEYRHHRVTDELLDRAAMTNEDPLDGLEGAIECLAHDLSVVPAGESGRPDDVRVEDSDELPFARHPSRLNGGRDRALRGRRLLL